jgi:peptidoglycan/LPS O-acetylase OafA/YrhL
LTQNPLKTHANSFDFLRLIAAIMVVYAHSYNLKGSALHEPIQEALGSTVGFGELAVLIFFAISGYLVGKSWLRDPNISRFLTRRLLRILPALCVVTCATCFIVGPFFTDRPLAEYVSSGQTWVYLLNSFVYPVHYYLPGVFTTNPTPGVVNGSIWTLRLEFSFYLVLIGFGIFGFLRRRFLGLAGVVLCGLASFGYSNIPVLQTAPFHWQLFLIASNGIAFFTGLHFALNPTKVTASGKSILAWAALALVLACLPYSHELALICISVATILIGSNTKLDLRRFGDYSYGLYVWGFLVEQSLLHFMPQLSSPSLFALSLVLTFVFAALSWHFVEKPCLNLKPSKTA